MTLPTSGSLSLSQVRGEHGGSLPLSMSQLLRGAASGYVHSTNTVIPAAAPLDLSDFRGTSRSGKYPVTVGRWAVEGGFQQGYHITAGGSLHFNNNYKGYTIQAIAWNEGTDGLFSVGFNEPNVPQSVLTTLITSKVGQRSVQTYYPNFWGVTLFVFGSSSTSPFANAGSVDSSIILY